MRERVRARGNNYAFEILRFAQNDKEIGRRETVDGRRMREIGSWYTVDD